MFFLFLGAFILAFIFLYKLFLPELVGSIESMEDPIKVQNKINELNNSEKPGDQGWFAVNDYFALTGFDYNNGKPIFKNSFGYPIKAFVNQKNGEMSLFPASMFERDKS